MKKTIEVTASACRVSIWAQGLVAAEQAKRGGSFAAALDRILEKVGKK